MSLDQELDAILKQKATVDGTTDMQMAVEQVAAAPGKYYNALLAAGIPALMAKELVVSWHSIFWMGLLATVKK